MVWYDMIWYDMIWYDMIWYVMIWYDRIWYDRIWYDMICNDIKYIWYDICYVTILYDIFLTAIGLPPGGSSTEHIYTKTVHRTTQNKQYIEQHKNLEECGPCPVFASYTLAFVLQLRKKQGKTSVRVAEQ